MKLFSKTKPKGRYFELNGYRFAIGMQFVINLTKHYNEINKCDAAIDDVMRDMLGNPKMTITNLENYRHVFMISLNTQAQIDDKKEYDLSLYDQLFDEHGFKFIGEVIYQITTSLAGLLFGEVEQTESKNETKKKD